MKETRYPGNFNPTTEIMKDNLKRSDEIPRRSCLHRMIRQEIMLYDMVQEVEKLGADPLLTEVVMILGQARDKLADYVEKANLIYPDPIAYEEWCKKHNINQK